MPYDISLGDRYECIQCDGMQVPNAADILTYPELGLVSERRQSQIDMANTLSDVMRHGGCAVIEAGTGVGKSYAYLLSAVLSGEKAIVSTAKKSLQAQILHKDLPRIQKLVGSMPRKQEYDYLYAAAYGKSNYYCQRRLEKSCKEDKETLMEVMRKSPSGLWDDFEVARKSAKRHLSIYPSVGLSADECVGAECSYFKEDCGYIEAKRRIGGAQIVVTNHWLLGFQLRLGDMIPLLGGAKRIIVDEAHKLEEGIRDAFSEEIKDNALEKLADKYDKSLQYFPDTFPDDLPGYTEAKKEWNSLFSSKLEHMGPIASRLATIIGTPITSLQGLAVVSNLARVTESGIIVDSAVLGTVLNDMISLRDALTTLSGHTNDDNLVGYIEQSGRNKVIRLVPVNIASVYRATTKNYVSQAHVSATLAIAGKTDVYESRVGITATDQAIYGSSFNLDKQAILYLSSNVPEPTRDEMLKDEYLTRLADEIATLVNANDGNAFVLFTARDEMQSVRDLLRKRVSTPIVMQHGSASETLQEFLKTDKCTLLGLKSFWEGVDVAGDKLSLVIITKLPFPAKNDPVVEARRRNSGTKWFHEVDLPDMIFDLRQGVGRLIRTEADRGVLAILDKRIVTKPYRNRVLNSLGFSKPTTNRDAVIKALNNLRAKRAK